MMYVTLKHRALKIGESDFLRALDWEVTYCKDLTRANRLFKQLRELTTHSQEFSSEFLQKINDYATILEDRMNITILELLSETP